MTIELRSTARQCLYANLLVDLEALPRLPTGYRYEVHDCGDGGLCAMVSLVAFRQALEKVGPVRLFGVSHPQLNVQACILDRQGVPALWVFRALVPPWVAPIGRRSLAGPVVRGGWLTYPRSSRLEDGRWRVGFRGGQVRIDARPGAGVAAGSGLDLGSLPATVRYVRTRHRGYCPGADGEGPKAFELDLGDEEELVPLRVEIEGLGELASWLGWAPSTAPGLHSAWLCTDLPVTLVPVPSPRRKVPTSAGRAATGECFFTRGDLRRRAE